MSDMLKNKRFNFCILLLKKIKKRRDALSKEISKKIYPMREDIFMENYLCAFLEYLGDILEVSLKKLKVVSWIGEEDWLLV